jgi:glycosyltransferase EpsD
VAVSSSRQEGLPVNVMEAMATGLPLVVSSSRGNRDLVIDGENGIIVDSDNVNEMSNALVKLYKSEELRQR